MEKVRRPSPRSAWQWLRGVCFAVRGLRLREDHSDKIDQWLDPGIYSRLSPGGEDGSRRRGSCQNAYVRACSKGRLRIPKPEIQFFNLDTDSELAFGLENEGRPPEEIRSRVTDTVEALYLQDLLGRSIFSLSGGQKQLLAFGSVYAMGPEIFVLDEPTANLDQDAISRLHDQIANLKRQGRTVVIAEHRLYFLTDLIDRALYLRDGVLERTFTREQFCALTNRGA